ncbi:MAG: ribonuclease HII [Candidatus Verstraetearchaeota archaeon]|nr:ribonuclease HII [Candidatus Verstraetearchaeota archaeon]
MVIQTKLIAGIDEAGRGPVIGPMVVAGIAIYEKDEANLLELGVKDSKKLSYKKREELYEKIIKIVKYHIEVIDAETIDKERKKKNLNDIEIDLIIKIINKLKPDVVQIGSPDINIKNFVNKIIMKVKNIQIISVHHAESIFPTVAAASILAKVTRDRIIENLKKIYGDFGSGYPSDPKTKDFILNAVKKGEIPNIIRKSWKTYINLI